MKAIILVASMFSFCAFGLSTEAQSLEAYARPDSAQGYWKVRASFADKTPYVQFYSARHQLLYQEQLPQNVRYTDRQTQRALDVLLANLVNSRVLATAYLPENPTTSITESPATAVISASGNNMKQSVVKDGQAVFFVDPAVSSVGKLTIHCAQLKRRFSNITLEDENRKMYYQGAFNDTSYKCVLNVQEMQSGVYTLKIGQPNHSFSYRLIIDQPVQRYELQKIDEQAVM
ncbi:hypothetical protein GCM10028807_14670 [Spirosoma daeguense]